MSDLADLEVLLGHAFGDRALLAQALTHPSWTNEQADAHNQRLEFLGDAVLGLCVARQLYDALPDADEGTLSRARRERVQGLALAVVARRLGLGAHLRMGRSARRDRVDENDDALEDTVEALIGAVYLDAGLTAAMALVERLVGAPSLPSPSAVNARSRLNELCQERWREVPRYALRERSGPEHAPLQTWVVSLPDGGEFTGVAANQVDAREAAARYALHAHGVTV